MPLEKQYNLTGRALQVIAANRFPMHIITKSDLVLRDLDILRRIAGTYAAVSFTVTTAAIAFARFDQRIPADFLARDSVPGFGVVIPVHGNFLPAAKRRPFSWRGQVPPGTSQ